MAKETITILVSGLDGDGYEADPDEPAVNDDVAELCCRTGKSPEALMAELKDDFLQILLVVKEHGQCLVETDDFDLLFKRADDN